MEKIISGGVFIAMLLPGALQASRSAPAPIPNILPAIGAGSTTTYDTANWVAQVYRGRGGTTLREMVIPGTHDSGTYNFSSSSALAPDAPGIYGAAKGIVADWGRTQSFNIYDMLKRGIRHFDLRILKKDGEFVIVHGLVGMRVVDVLEQVQRFAEEHPREPIILEVAKTPAAADIPALLDLFDARVGNRKPGNGIPAAALTLDHMWAPDATDGKNNSIVVVWTSGGSDDARARGYYGPEHFDGTWADTTNAADLRHRLLNGWTRKGRVYRGLKNAPTDKLFYSAFTFTPGDNDIIKDVFNVFSSGSILKWTRDWMRPYLGEWVAEWVEQGHRPNIMTADFFEYTAMVPLAIRLNTVKTPAPPGPLRLKWATHADKVWGDHGSGADRDGAVFRLRARDGFYPLGDIPADGYTLDGAIERYLVQDGQAGVIRPLGYNWIWNDVKSGADTDLSIWRPIAPAGYVCLGDVVTTNHGIAPSRDLIRCVHESYTRRAARRVFKWNDSGSGARWDVSFWHGASYSDTEINSGAMRAFRSHGTPSMESFHLLIREKTRVVVEP